MPTYTWKVNTVIITFTKFNIKQSGRIKNAYVQTALLIKNKYVAYSVWVRIFYLGCFTVKLAYCVWNVMSQAQKPDFVFRRNGRVNLKRRGRQFSLLLAAEVRASAVVMLDTPCSEVVWRVLATHSIRQFLLHFPSRVSPCSITLQMESNANSNFC